MRGDAAGLAKLRRAGEHLEAFDYETRSWAALCPYRVAVEEHADGLKYVWRVYGIQPVPERLAIIAGDCFFNLRAALDHLVYARSLPIGDFPRCEFPIFEEPAGFHAVKRNGDPQPNSGLWKIRGMQDDEQAVVESLQPYHAENAEDPSVAATCDNLRALHHFNNVDKHRALHLSVTSVNEVVHSPALGVRFIPEGGALKDGAVVATATRSSTDTKMDADPIFGLGVAFDQPDGSLQAANALLWACHRAVREVFLRVAGVETEPIDVLDHVFIRLVDDGWGTR